MTHRRRGPASALSLLLGLSLLAASCATAPRLEPLGALATVEEAPLPVDPRIATGTLENGLTWYVLPHRKPENRAQLWLVVDAGSVQEDDDQRGLAHFVEHMAFNGTENYPKQEIVDYIEGVGMRFGPDLNAYTSFDETVYMLQVPTDDEALVDKGLDILREWAGRVAFDPEEVDKERGVVLEEWRLGRGAWGRVRDQQYPVLMHGSRYAERLPIGDPSIIETAPRDTLVRYYRDWYRPDLMAIVAVGDFDRDAMIAKIREAFAGLDPAARPRPRETFPVPMHDETLVTAVTDEELPSTSVTLVTKLPARGQSTRSDYRRGLVDRLYASMMNARFFEMSQQLDAPFLRAGMGFGSLTRTADQVGRSAGAKEGRVLDALRVLVDETARVEQHGFTATELERAKTSYLRGIERAALERDKTDGSAFASEIARHFLEGEAMPGVDVELEMTREMLPGITLEEVNALARKTSGMENRVILVTGPAKTPLPDEEEILAVARAGDDRVLAAWDDRVPTGPLVATEPVPGAIVAEGGVPEIDVTEWTLSNGARVVVKPSDFQNDSVSFTAWSPGGESNVPDDAARAMGLAATVVAESGLGEMTSVELRKALTGKVASVRPYISTVGEGMWGGGSPEDLETLLQLVWLYFEGTRIDEEAIAAWKTRAIEALRNELLDPNTVFAREFDRVRTGGHPRMRPLTVEDVEGLDLDALHAFYRERFADASDFSFFFVGNVEIATLRPLAEKWLGSLPSLRREEAKREIDIPFPSGVTKIEVPKGIEPKSRVRIAFGGRAEWTREAEIDARLLNEVLNIRLREILREDMGGVYGVSIRGGLSREAPQTFVFEVQFGCAPEQVDPLIAAVFDTLREVREGGIGEVYLGKVRETWKRSREVQLKQNNFWLNALAWAWRWNDDLVANLDLEKNLARVTSENVQSAANRYLDPDNHVVGVLRPAD